MGCCKIVKIFGFIGLAMIVYHSFHCCQNPSLPILEPNPWWGPGEPSKSDSDIVPFTVKISKTDIADIKTRLALPHRLTPALENSNFSYGITADVLSEITDYWRTKFDWANIESRMNKFPQFKTQIEGIDIHFLHVKPEVTSGKKVVPLLLLHGWPGSVLEFDQILPILTSPQEGSDIIFEVICPHIPGYGFSQGSSKMGLGAPQTGQIFLKLMKRLGMEKFYVQGGDWGSLIARIMATYYQDNILGMHVNMMTVSTPATNFKYALGAYLPSGMIMPPESEKTFYPFSKFFSLVMREMGYAHIQSTKPDTIGSALNDSPVGLLAYILEKFSFWTKPDNVLKANGALLDEDFPISLDRILDNISYYWFSRSITTSMRFYAENMPYLFTVWKIDEVPTYVWSGFSNFKYELANYPENFLAHKYKNILSYTRHEMGGHFAAMENPTVLAKDVFHFVNLVEKKVKETKSEL